MNLKKNNNFLIEFPDVFDIRPWTVQTANKPKFTNNKWEEIKISFIDLIGPSTSQSLVKMVDFLIDKEKQKNNYLFEIKIKTLDPTYKCIEEWVILVDKVLTINFGDLNYGDDSMQEPYIVIKPLKCVLNY